MQRRTNTRILAPLAGAAIIAALAMPTALAFVAATAGREDAARDKRLMSAVAKGYLESLMDIERHRLAYSNLPSDPQFENRTLLRVGPDARIIARSGPGAARADFAAIARRTALERRSEKARPEPAQVALNWTGTEPLIVGSLLQGQDPAVAVSLLPVPPPLLQSDIAVPLGLEEIDLQPEPKGRRPGRSEAEFHLVDGSRGVIAWRTDDMNTVILRKLAPVALAAFLVLSALGGWLYRRTRLLTQEVLANQARARHMALHDPLTGLANRSLLANRADLALEQRRRQGGVTAFCVIDLDAFKSVNDTLGHVAGDALIRIAAERLLAVSRASDTAARMGGDEFALIAALSHADDIHPLARRLVDSFQDEVAVPGGRARLSASVGIALVDAERIDSAEALRRADLALYRAKTEGRGRYSLYESAMDESLALRRTTEADLRQALAQGQLQLAYQPQVTTRTNRLKSVEALIRWTHPLRGPISPDYFIPIAEESGLIHEIGDFVLRRACVDSLNWPSLTVAVNISPLQIKTGGFVERCRRILEEEGVEPSRIELEITEGVLLDASHEVQASLQQLKAMGFSIALDDFGTGYSSLSYLNAFAVDKIKIDRAFVERIGSHQDAEKVIRAIIRLGRTLGLKVIAEGVETEAQRAELAASGCGLIQGYLNGAPARPEDITAQLKLRASTSPG